MSNLSSEQLNRIYKQARRRGRMRRPQEVNVIPKLQSGGYVRKGTIRAKPQRGLGLGGVLIGIAGLATIVLAVNGIEIGWLNIEIPTSIRVAETVPAATDNLAWYAMLEAEEAGDAATLARLTQDGRIFTVAQDRPVRVDGIGFTGIRVRVLEGRDEGRIGWVPFGAVKVW